MTSNERARVVAHGVGRVEVVPDLLMLTLAAFTRAAEPGQALRDSAARVTAMLAALDAAGVAKDDQRTTGLQVQQDWDHSTNPPTVLGFWASENVQVTLREARRVPEIVEAVSDAIGEALRVNGLSFGLSDPESARAQARRRAVQGAIAQAAELADAAGARLDGLVSIEESGGGDARFIEQSSFQLAAGGAPPVAPGTMTVAVHVTVVYDADEQTGRS